MNTSSYASQSIVPATTHKGYPVVTRSGPTPLETSILTPKLLISAFLVSEILHLDSFVDMILLKISAI